MVYNENIKKVCSFYVSDWHFVTMLLPHVNEKINEKVKIATILQDEAETYMTTLLEKLKLENKEKILNINWNKSDLNEESISKALEEDTDEIEFIIKGDLQYIKKANEKIIKLSKESRKNISIINCYNVNEYKDEIADILSEHDMILNTSGMQEKDKYITNIKY